MKRLLAAACAVALGACDTKPPAPAPAPSTAPHPTSPSARATASSPRLPVEIVAAPAEQEPLASLVPREAARAKKEGRTLLIYVGATWCEPCKRFHDAAVAGKLDDVFPGLRLLEFDRDRDEARLQEAGCITRLIPLFAKPTADGRCSEARIMGSIKGPGAVAQITPRLERVLATP